MGDARIQSLVANILALCGLALCVTAHGAIAVSTKAGTGLALGERCRRAGEVRSNLGRVRYQRERALNELQRRYRDVSGAIMSWALQMQHGLASAIALEPLVGNGRVGDETDCQFAARSLLSSLWTGRGDLS